MLFLRYYLWIAPHLLVLIALLWMFPRKLHKKCSFFVVYLMLQLASFVNMFTVDFLGAWHLATRNEYLWTLVIWQGLTAVAEIEYVHCGPSCMS